MLTVETANSFFKAYSRSQEPKNVLPEPYGPRINLNGDLLFLASSRSFFK